MIQDKIGRRVKLWLIKRYGARDLRVRVVGLIGPGCEERINGLNIWIEMTVAAEVTESGLKLELRCK